METISIEGPELLDVPDKLLQLLLKINDYRYFLIKGGRGGAKSQSIGRILLYIASKLSLRIVCGRETQNTIQESVYNLMADLIRHWSLNFEIQANKISSRDTYTDFSFRGFRQQGAFNIQGMEGIDIVWIDESQALTKQTLDVLIPTIRKNNSKVIFSMNPHVADDPVVVAMEGRDDCLIIDISYLENKHCPEVLIHEANVCKAKSLDDYNHIWMGLPLALAENQLFSYAELVDSSVNRYQLRDHYGTRIGAFDIARFGDDKCAAVVLQQMGALHWEVVYVDEWGKQDLNFTTGRILQIINEQNLEMAIIDEDGLGSGPLDTLKKGRNMDNVTGFRNTQIAYDKNKDYANVRTLNAYKVKDMISKRHLSMTQSDLMKEGSTIRYTYDHQQRKILISKEEMKRKYGVKSPNQFDALIMACSLIEAIKFKQDQPYRPKQNTVQPEKNLWQIAGIR